MLVVENLHIARVAWIEVGNRRNVNLMRGVAFFGEKNCSIEWEI